MRTIVLIWLDAEISLGVNGGCVKYMPTRMPQGMESELFVTNLWNTCWTWMSGEWFWLLELLAYFHLTCSVNVFHFDVIDFVVPIKFLSKLQLWRPAIPAKLISDIAHDFPRTASPVPPPQSTERWTASKSGRKTTGARLNDQQRLSCRGSFKIHRQSPPVPSRGRPIWPSLTERTRSCWCCCYRWLVVQRCHKMLLPCFVG